MTQGLLPLIERDHAMEVVEHNANTHRARFTEDAYGFVVRYLRGRGTAPGEEITNACKDAGIVPHDDRAFGPVYMRLSRDGTITKVGQCSRNKGHGTSGGNIWALTI